MKITLRLGRLEVAFATALELRDALLQSFVDADYAGGPFVMVGPDDAQPAWTWVAELIRKRTDWRPALGIALQHAAHEGGDRARVALADLLANFRESMAELEWTSPLAQRWPDVRATKANTGFGGGGQTPRLADVVVEQKSVWGAMAAEPTLFLDEYGPAGEPVIAKVFDTTSLPTALVETAKAGRAPAGKGPWSWLGGEIIYRAWLAPALVSVIGAVVANRDDARYAFLDWTAEEMDLWRFVDLLEGWTAQPPGWSSDPAGQAPPGWQYPVRSSAWPGIATLGDVVASALDRARAQAATPAIVDLQPRP